MRPLSLALLAVGLLAACDGTIDRAPGTRSNNGTNVNRDAGTNPSPDAGTVTADHAAMCNQACANGRGPCGGPEDQAACNNACAATTNGFNAVCAACILQESAYAGRECTCYGEGCNLCSFGAGDSPCNSATPDDVCQAEDEVCRGYDIAPASGSACRQICFSDSNPPDLADTFTDRCNQICGQRPNACADADVAGCVAACTAQAQALPPSCAVCVLERSGWSGQACTCYGQGCSLCSFGAEDAPCAGGSEQTCAPADESCDGLEFGRISDCAELCEG